MLSQTFEPFLTLIAKKGPKLPLIFRSFLFEGKRATNKMYLQCGGWKLLDRLVAWWYLEEKVHYSGSALCPIIYLDYWLIIYITCKWRGKVHVMFYGLTLTCIIVQLKDYTQKCYVGQRMALVGVGEFISKLRSVVWHEQEVWYEQAQEFLNHYENGINASKVSTNTARIFSLSSCTHSYFTVWS